MRTLFKLFRRLFSRRSVVCPPAVFTGRTFQADELPTRPYAVFFRCRIECPAGTLHCVLHSPIPRHYEQCLFVHDDDDPLVSALTTICRRSRL
jgi:hypothetical protein